MIKYFAVENFKSIKSENILEFDSHIPEDTNFVANTVIGFAGANASGKTAILQAITFTLWFMQDSFLSLEEGDDIPFEPFRMRVEDSSKFHIIFSKNTFVDNEMKTIDYEYELEVNRERVLYEKLYYFPYGRKRIAYQRENKKVIPGATVSHIQTKDLRQNCSIVSFASQFDSQRVAKECKNYVFHSNLTSKGMQEEEFHIGVLESLIGNEERRTLFRVADIGIEDIRIEEQDREESKQLIRRLKEMDDKERDPLSQRQLERLEELMESEDFVLKRPLIRHRIEGDIVDFAPGSESAGTLRFFIILDLVLEALKKGYLLILDEIEIKLHQNLVAYIIGLFQNQVENPNGAQLIFSFHNSSLMEILTPEQLWFAEKNDAGYTELFSAADFKDIRNIHRKNLEQLYRIGRFGAKPRGI